MKKVFTGLLSLLLAFGVFMGSASVLAVTDEAAIKESYEKVLNYYAISSSTLTMLDEIIALGNAGVDLKNFEVKGEYDLNQDFTKLSAGKLSKHIIACIFMGVNPNDVNGVNLLSMLESYVKEDGSVETTYDANDLVWCVFALKSLDSSKTELVADKLVTLQKSDDTTVGIANNNGGYGSYISLDSTAWCVEALSLVNKEKYNDSIQLALQYFSRKQLDDNSYQPNDDVFNGTVYPGTPNTDTQACIVQSLLVYDAAGVKAGAYNKNGASIFDIILANQNVNGGFGYTSSDFVSDYSSYAATNVYSTYFNGSFVLNANQAYKQLLTPKPSVPEVVVEKPAAPVTGETNDIFGLFSLLVSSMAVVMIVGRKYAKAH